MQEPIIIPISGISVNWMQFVSQAAKLARQSPTRSLDEINMPTGSDPTFIAALAEFEQSGTNPIEALKNHERLLSVIQYGFLCSADRAVTKVIAIQTELTIILSESYESVFCLFGSLLDLRSAIIFCNGYMQADYDVRKFFTILYLLLRKQGFEDIFSRWQRKEQSDGTISFRLIS